MPDLFAIDKNRASKINFTKIFAILTIGICLLIWLVLPLHMNSPSGYILVILLTSSAISLLLHYLKLFNASRLILIHFLALGTAIAHAYQMQSNEEPIAAILIFQVAYVTLPLAVFDFSEKKSLVISICLNLVILLLTPLFNNTFNEPPELTNLRTGIFAQLLFWSGGILAILPLLYSASQSNKWLHELSAKVEENKTLIEHSVESDYRSSNLLKFSAIMRDYNDSMDILCSKALSSIVEVLQCGHGAIYIYNKESNLLEIVSSYAFDGNNEGKKYILPGETLAGQAFSNKKTMHVVNVSADYHNIKSGLGFGKPSELLIVPVVFNDDCYGVIELASFNSFKKAEMRLLEQLSELLAATVSNIQNNMQNVDLVEKLQHQAEELKAQEEELMTNIESLNGVHNEMEELKLKTAKRVEQQMSSQRDLMEKTVAKYNDTVLKLQENEHKLALELTEARKALEAKNK